MSPDNSCMTTVEALPWHSALANARGLSYRLFGATVVGQGGVYGAVFKQSACRAFQSLRRALKSKRARIIVQARNTLANGY